MKRGAQVLGGLVRRCCLALSVTMLAGCLPLQETLEISPFLREQITGDTWRACLAREYQAQARPWVRNGRHWSEATRLSGKGRRALAGEQVLPEEVGAGPLRPAYETLLGLRDVQDKNPCACATAQARFDGWLVAEDAGLKGNHRDRFEQALATCQAPR